MNIFGRMWASVSWADAPRTASIDTWFWTTRPGLGRASSLLAWQIENATATAAEGQLLGMSGPLQFAEG
jgi:hypothetical protein